MRASASLYGAMLLGLGLMTPRDGLALAVSAPRAISNLSSIDNDVLQAGGTASLASVACGDNGTWIAAWWDEGLPVVQGKGVHDVLFARSTDGGASWSGPDYIDPAAGTIDNYDPSVATNGAEGWLFTASRFIPVEGVFLFRSIDDGGTWSSPVQLSDAVDFTSLSGTSMSTDRNGVWVVAWTQQLPGSDSEVYFVRSIDDGASWSAPAPLNEDAATDPYNDYDVELATDRSGNWVATWTRGSSVVSARSSDNGQTWSPYAYLGPGFYGSSLATDREGNWVVAWSNANGAYFSRSQDNGSTWTAPSLIVSTEQNAGTLSLAVDSIVYLEQGRWTVAMGNYGYNFGGTIGKEEDILVADSFDGGQSWDPPSLLNVNGRKDAATASDANAAIAVDGLGRTVAVWESLGDLDGVMGTDGEIVFAVSDAVCPPTPRTGCASAGAQSSHLSIRDGVGGKDRMKWRWRGGDAVASPDLGDPTSTSSYALCVYASVGGSLHPVMQGTADAGSTCSGMNCWSANSAGYAYRDSQLTRGAIKDLSVSEGDAGRASMRVSLAGPSTGPAYLPVSMTSAVVAQLVNLETSACWTASFSAASANDTSRFSATSD